MAYNLGNTHSVDRQIALGIGFLTASIPMRLVGLHFCVDQPNQRVMATLASVMLGIQNTIRSRCHYGMYFRLANWMQVLGCGSLDSWSVC